MKSLRTVCAVLICFVLVAAQTVFISHAQAASTDTEQSCDCGACEVMQCCITQPTTPASQQPAPVQVPRSVSQTQLQFVATIIALVCEPPTTPIRNVIPTTLLSSTATAVPLYTWNCSYLI